MTSSAFVPITRERVIQRQVVDVFATLANLRNHWQLDDAFEVCAVHVAGDGSQSGATVRVRGPFGLRRTVRTALTSVLPVNRIDGEARVGRSRAHVSWVLREVSAERTHVELSLRMTRAGLLDRFLLVIGGRLWLHHELAVVLSRLERVVAHAQVASVVGRATVSAA